MDEDKLPRVQNGNPMLEYNFVRGKTMVLKQNQLDKLARTMQSDHRRRKDMSHHVKKKRTGESQSTSYRKTEAGQKMRTGSDFNKKRRHLSMIPKMP